MRSQHNRHQQHRCRSQQFDLFRGSDNARQQRLDWEALPSQTREVLTDLMVRLILDHKENDCRPQPRETHHDD
jgi:hypothetical protein